MTQFATQTKFQKDQFRWDGTYLHYMGRHTKSVNWDELYPDCHPSNVGVNKMEFIARFKYGRKPYKTWINFLVKNFTVEEYVELTKNCHMSNGMTPLAAMKSKGFKEPNRKRG
tara:strand:- start:63 stop:401 length:339 start_codon:yes stop_codon:yes gene_type:complete